MALSVSSPTTPTSRPFGRILRSFTKNRRTHEKNEASQKITGFFNVRKRLIPSYGDKPETFKKRRGVIITNAVAHTPSGGSSMGFPVVLPLSQFTDDYAPSPPKRARRPTSLGVFDAMGDFERFDFLSSLPISYMSKIALTSHEWAGALTKYLESNSWKKRFILLANTYQKDVSNEDPFATTGALLKALTIPKLTVDRINFMISFVEAVHDDVKQVDGWFRLFSSFSHCWAFHEKNKVVRAIKQMNGGRLEKLVRTVLSLQHGERADLELETRRLLLGYFAHPLTSDTFTPAEKTEASFWMSCILKALHNNTAMHGRLCMIMFAPVNVIDGTEQINWRTLVDDVVISMEDADARLAPLANGVSALLSLRNHVDFGVSWRYDEIFNLIEEITTFPNPWSFDNFVAFLMPKNNILSVAVTTRINHSHREEAGQIINTMKTLMFRWGVDTTEALLTTYRQIMNELHPRNKQIFVRSILDAHITQYREFLCMGDAARLNCDEETAAFIAFSPIFNESLHLLR